MQFLVIVHMIVILCYTMFGNDFFCTVLMLRKHIKCELGNCNLGWQMIAGHMIITWPCRSRNKLLDYTEMVEMVITGDMDRLNKMHIKRINYRFESLRGMGKLCWTSICN